MNVPTPPGYHARLRVHRKAYDSRNRLAKLVAFHEFARDYPTPRAMAATILAHAEGIVRLAEDEWVAWHPAGGGYVDVYLLGPEHVSRMLSSPKPLSRNHP